MSETTTAAAPVRTWEGLQIPAPGRYDLDVSHTRVGFVARHLVISKVRGQFGAFTGAVTIADEPVASSVEVDIEAASFSSGDAQRDGHVVSADFLDVEQHPVLRYRSTGVRHVRGDEFVVDGELTVKDVTRPVALELTFTGVQADPWGGQRFGFEAVAEIDREDFGITWNVALESGGVLVGKKVRIEIEGEAVRADG